MLTFGRPRGSSLAHLVLHINHSDMPAAANPIWYRPKNLCLNQCNEILIYYYFIWRDSLQNRLPSKSVLKEIFGNWKQAEIPFLANFAHWTFFPHFSSPGGVVPGEIIETVDPAIALCTKLCLSLWFISRKLTFLGFLWLQIYSAGLEISTSYSPRRVSKLLGRVQILDVLLHLLKALAQCSVLSKLSFHPCSGADNHYLKILASPYFSNAPSPPTLYLPQPYQGVLWSPSLPIPITNIASWLA